MVIVDLGFVVLTVNFGHLGFSRKLIQIFKFVYIKFFMLFIHSDF